MKKEFEKEQNDNQIDDAFLDMPDMEDDEKFRQWLEEEYLKEADAIEESLFDGRKFEDNQDIVEKLSVSRESFYQPETPVARRYVPARRRPLQGRRS